MMQNDRKLQLIGRKLYEETYLSFEVEHLVATRQAKPKRALSAQNQAHLKAACDKVYASISSLQTSPNPNFSHTRNVLDQVGRHYLYMQHKQYDAAVGEKVDEMFRLHKSVTQQYGRQVYNALAQRLNYLRYADDAQKKVPS